MRHIVGDKVKVRKDLKICGTYGGYYVTDNMHKMTGKTVTISSVCNDVYEICEDNGKCYWTDEMFDPAAKDLIQPGSIVECRSGNKYIYINGLFMHSDGWMFMGNGGLKDFSDDLIFLNGDENFDIMRIFESKARALNGVFEPIYLTSVWERREAKEMTLEEIEKILGYPIKIVKGAKHA